MRTSLRAEISRALDAYDPSAVESAVGGQHPKQAVTTANHVVWTARIQAALQAEDRQGLATLSGENAAFMAELSSLVLKEENVESCMLYANLLLAQGYFGSILEALAEKEVTAADSFDWVSRLRYFSV